MADWTISLPDPAEEGSTTHIQDHNLLVDALEEARANLDVAEADHQAALDNLQDALDGKQDAGNYQPAGDYATTAQVNAKADQSELDALSTEVDGKQAAGNYATTAQVNAKADQSALDALVARVESLEAPDPE